jgi:hypothetical protein
MSHLFLRHSGPHYFVSYNAIRWKQFRPLGRFGPDQTERLVREGVERTGQQER